MYHAVAAGGKTEQTGTLVYAAEMGQTGAGQRSTRVHFGRILGAFWADFLHIFAQLAVVITKVGAVTL